MLGAGPEAGPHRRCRPALPPSSRVAAVVGGSKPEFVIEGACPSLAIPPRAPVDTFGDSGRKSAYL